MKKSQRNRYTTVLLSDEYQTNSYKTKLFAEKILDLANLFFAGYVLTILFQDTFSLLKFLGGLCISFGLYVFINFIVK